MATDSTASGTSCLENHTTPLRAICVIAQSSFDREAAIALLLQSVPICHDSYFVGPEANPVSTPIDLILVFWEPGALQVLDQVERLIRNGVKAPTLFVVENERQSLVPLRNIRLMGVFAKTDGPEKFSEAVRTVAAGGTYFSQGVRIDSPDSQGNGISIAALSQRERDLLPLLAEGLPLREAAIRLGIGYKTADAHRTALFRKLGVRDRVSLVRLAIREGLTRI
jgi:DNA-binding NarL/FixJ family response regulator